MTPDKAFILAAGFGKRLRPYTDNTPKPMVKVGGKPMIDYALDELRSIGVKSCIVNTHYKAEMLQRHCEALMRRSNLAPDILLSHEPEILDTGGGLKNGIKLWGESANEDFFVLSGDSVWENAHAQNTLQALANAWNPKDMDILMLLQPVDTMTLTRGVGDYDIEEDGKAARSFSQSGKYMFTSIRINAGRIFETAPDSPFSYLQLMDKAQEEGRLFGLIHQGAWHHISTPNDLEKVNNHYAAR